jgi:hypothetical protein
MRVWDQDESILMLAGGVGWTVNVNYGRDVSRDQLIKLIISLAPRIPTINFAEMLIDRCPA